MIGERWSDYRVFSYYAHGPALEPKSLALAEDDWLAVCLTRERHVDDVRLQDVAGQPYRTVDVLRSPAIEVTRCYQDAELIRPGRMFFDHGYYEGQSWIEKDEEFVAWAKQILSMVRRAFPEYSGYRIGPEARALIDAKKLRFSPD